MRLNGFYPVLLTGEVAKASGFFTEHMGFKTSTLLLNFASRASTSGFGRQEWRSCSRSRTCPSGSDTSSAEALAA